MTTTLMRTLGSLCAAAALLAAPACGWKSDGAERLEELYPTPPPPPPDPCPLPDDPGAAAASFGDEGCGDLGSGRWAVRLVQFGSMKPIGSVWRITLSDHFLAEANPDGQTLDLTFCSQASALSLSDGSPIGLGKTNMPEKTRKAIAAVPLLIPMPGGGAAFQAADIAWLWGVKDLANPVTDPLPTDKADAHVWDQDGDGKPGVTVEVLNPRGERYMARRSRWSFAAATVGAQWATGQLTFAVDEKALDASIDQLETVATISPRSECTSVYQMRCVQAATTCEQVNASTSALWRDAPK